MSYKVEVEYFKPSGKYYSSGEYTSDKEHLFHIWDEFKEMCLRGERPGLVYSRLNDKGKRYIGFPFVYINVPDHPFDHPHLTVFDIDEYGYLL